MHRRHQTQSIFSKTNQKLNISYISNIKALKGKFFPVQVLNKPTLKFQLLLHTLGGLFIITTIHTSLRRSYFCYIHSEDSSILLRFTLHYGDPTFVTYTRRTLQYYYDSHFATEFIWRFKNQRNPTPKHVELQIIGAYINQQMLEYALFEEE